MSNVHNYLDLCDEISTFEIGGEFHEIVELILIFAALLKTW